MTAERPDYGQLQPGALAFLAVLLLASGLVAILIPFPCAKILAALATFSLAGLLFVFLRLTDPGRQRRLAGAMVELVEPPAPCSVLDVGSGAGLTAVEFAMAFPEAQIIGLDLYVPSGYRSGLHIEDALRNARLEGVEDRVEFRKGHLRDLPFPGGAFDLVTCRSSLFTLDEAGRVRAIEEIRRVLRPGGAFVWLEPAFLAFWPAGRSERAALRAGFVRPRRRPVGQGAVALAFSRPRDPFHPTAPHLEAPSPEP